MATPNSIAQLMIKEFGGSTSVTAAITKVESYVNDAYKDLFREMDWPWAQTVESINTVNGTQEYSLQTTAAEVIAARMAGSLDTEVVVAPVQWLLANDMEATSGTPTHLFHSGYDSSTGKSKIKLYPVPNAALVLMVFEAMRPADLATGGTIPIPEEFIPILKHKCRFFMATDEKDYDAANFWLKVYSDEVAKAKIRYGTKPVGARSVLDLGGGSGNAQ